MIQVASSNPPATIGVHLPIRRGITMPDATAMPNAHFSRETRSGNVALRQREIGPTAIRNRAGAISG